jgi:membrane protein DedA with SNARE-associated domain
LVYSVTEAFTLGENMSEALLILIVVVITFVVTAIHLKRKARRKQDR